MGKLTSPKPDYARIAQLEQELGIGSRTQERGIRRDRAVCLTKGCDGDTHEVRLWSGQLVRRLHTCA